MKPLVWVLAVVVAAPVLAQDKGKQDKGKQEKEKSKPSAASVEDLLKQADEKAAALDIDGAAEVLKRAAAMPGATGEPSLRLGRLLENKQDVEAALDAYKAAAEKLTGPAQGEALGRMSLVQEMRGVPEATATAEAASTADAAGVWPTIAMSRARSRQGKGDEALALAQKAAAAGGGVAAASAAVGFAQEARADLAAAEAAYRSALAEQPGRISASVGLARVLRKTGRAAEAEPLLQKAIEAAPGAVDAYKESARVKLALNRPDDAVSDAALAAAMAEQDPEAKRLVQQVTVAKALVFVKTNQADLAIQDLTRLRDEQPDLADARVGLAKAYIAKRQPDLAIAELQKAVELEPKNAEAQFQLGFVNHVMKGNAAAAVGPYEKAVAAEPSNTGYRTNLGATLSDTKQNDRAIEELKKVVESPGYDRADAWIYLGRAYLGAKKYKDAITPLERAVAIAPTSADAEASLGWCYFGLKDSSNFKLHAGKAKSLGYKEPTLLQYLQRIEGGEAIK